MILSALVKQSMSEYTRPWKVATLGAGMVLLLVGSFYYQIPDWDIPISVIMAFLTYLAAPWSLRVLIDRRWKLVPVALLAAWFSVDGCYYVYWRFRNPDVLETMRSANFTASLCLYFMCGLIWLHPGRLCDLVKRRQANECARPKRRGILFIAAFLAGPGLSASGFAGEKLSPRLDYEAKLRPAVESYLQQVMSHSLMETSELFREPPPPDWIRKHTESFFSTPGLLPGTRLRCREVRNPRIKGMEIQYDGATATASIDVDCLSSDKAYGAHKGVRFKNVGGRWFLITERE